MSNFSRTLRRKAQPTRKQERKANVSAVKAMADNQRAQALIFQIYFKTYRAAVELYFGRDLPAELVELLEAEVKAGIENAAKQGEDIDLLPTVTKLVQDFVAAQAVPKDEAVEAVTEGAGGED